MLQQSVFTLRIEIHIDTLRHMQTMLEIGKRAKARRTEQQVIATYFKNQIEAINRARNRSRSFIIIATICLAAPLSVIFWTMPGWLSDIHTAFSHAQPQQIISDVSISSKSVPAEILPNEYRTETTSVTQQYMSGLLTHNYQAMWSLLHPEVQAMWPSETAFAQYWQNRFQGYTLQRYSIGQAHWLTGWVNPETRHNYRHVLEIPVSLMLSPGHAIQQDPLAPPEDLHPTQLFQNVPFILKAETDSHGKVIHWLVLDGGPADLEAPILPPLHPMAVQVHVPIMMYHYISSTPPTNSLKLSLTVTPTLLSQQLDYLKQQGYQTITFNQLFDALYYAGPLPKNPIVLSFDDGYEDAYQVALPILKAHGYSGMFYIITGKVGWQGYMNWNQLHSLYVSGMQIGSHTVHHLDLGIEYSDSPQLAQQEVQQAQTTLEQKLSILIQQFCYPSGEPFKTGSLYLQQHIMAMLAADGYVGATTDPGKTGTNQSSLLPLDLLRIRVDGRNNLQTFENSLLW